MRGKDCKLVGGLLKSTIAGDEYRRLHQKEIRECVLNLSAIEICQALTRFHLTGLFQYEFSRYSWFEQIERSLAAPLLYQKKYTELLQQEIGNIERLFSRVDIYAVLLKGPSLWGRVYPIAATRRTRDVDLMINTRSQMRAALRILQNDGFIGDFDLCYDIVDRNEHYELPTLSKIIDFNVDMETDQVLREYSANQPQEMMFCILGPRRFAFRIDLELHKSLFIFADGTYPNIPSSIITSHPWFPMLRVLSYPAQLPYLSAKFFMDISGLEDLQPVLPQAVKLLADVVRILEGADQPTISESIKIAKLWHAESYYGRTVATARELLPGITVNGIRYAPIQIERVFLN